MPPIRKDLPPINIRQDIERDRLLNRSKPRFQARAKAAGGLQWRTVSTGSSVFLCPSCGAPVVSSSEGRQAHVARMPACKKAVYGC